MALPSVTRLPGLPFEIALRASSNARRFTLRVSALDGAVTLTCPSSTTLRAAQGFLEEHREWLESRVQSAPQPILVAPGVDIPIEGQGFRIAQDASVLRAYAADGQLWLPPGPAGPLAERFLKTHAERRLGALAQHYAARLSRPIGKISYRDTRSRWGSCTGAGNLMFSWRLAMAPAAVLDYVVAHEAAHLVEMNHGPKFWDLVDKICPGYPEHRQWLRQNGAQLHRYRFAG